jgi:predicted alpha-1,2-mannosidase
VMRARATTVLILAAVAAAITPGAAMAKRHPSEAPAPSTYVDPFNGTAAGAPNFGTGGGAGNTFPGAVAPFGMLAWSPQTVPDTVNFAGGYSYADDQLSGLSLTHLSGAGCAAGGDISFLPTIHRVDVSPATLGSSNLNSHYLASFSHQEESAQPGYYEVELNPGTPNAINTELTAMARAGAGRFTFPASRTSSLLINAGASANADTAAEVHIDPATRTVTGSASSGRFCYQRNSYKVYFAAQFDRPFAAYGTWFKQLTLPYSTSSSDSAPGAINYTPFPGGPPSLPGSPSGTAQAGAFLTFNTTADRMVEVRVGLSYVSAADALQNLRQETGTSTFDQLRSATTASWNQALGRIGVAGGTLTDRQTFYTALYHVLLEPSVFSDVNGNYEGMDGRVHTVAPGHAQYADVSGWDIYRSEIPLLAMIDPSQTSDMAQSLVNDAQQSGWLPKWPVADGQTNVMDGDSADPIIADAYAFGAHTFDTAHALQAMVHGATTGGVGANGQYVERPALATYEHSGYIPHQDNGSSIEATFVPTVPWGSVSTTLEYASDDFALAQFAARARCETSDYRHFLQRSGDWANVFDPALKIVAARSANGSFVAGSSATSTADFVEGDAAQYTWMVPFDLKALFGRMGGASAARGRLDAFFTQLNSGPSSTTAFLGNEPTLETPWEYDWVRAPFRTQRVVRQALLTLFGPGPGDMPGNDDLGEMSSWYVLGAVGLYPEVPGSPILAVGSPLFSRITLQLGRHRVTLRATGASNGSPFVHALRVDGRRYNRPWISFAQLSRARTLRFRLGRAPDRAWGSSARAEPPSYPAGSTPPSCTNPPEIHP